MVCFFRVSRCFVLVVIFLINFTACSEKTGVSHTPDISERPVDFQPLLQATFPERILNSPLATDVNLPNATWSAPINIYSTTLATNENNVIYGPDLVISDAGNHYLTIHQNRLLDPTNDDFINKQGLAFGKEIGQENWSIDLPYALESAQGTADLQIELNTVTGGAYAIWTRDGSLYISQKTAAEVWQQEVLIWQREVGTQELLMIDLLVDINGDAWIVWINGEEVNISQFISSDLAGGLQTAQSVIINNALQFSKPVISNSGLLSLCWIGLPEGPLQPNLLQLIQFDPAAGWSSVDIAQAINTANFMSIHLNMTVAIDDVLMMISQDGFGRIYGIRYDPVTKWSQWENVDYNIGRDDIIAHSAKLVSNLNDNVMAIWSEETYSVVAGNITYIYASVFNPLGDANGNHWPTPELVGSTKIRIDPNAVDQVNFKTFPLLKMMSDGKAIAAWLDTTQKNSVLFANQYLPESGWALIPDQIISYGLYTDGVIRSADLNITHTGNAFITWQQLKKIEFAKQYQFWVSNALL